MSAEQVYGHLKCITCSPFLSLDYKNNWFGEGGGGGGGLGSFVSGSRKLPLLLLLHFGMEENNFCSLSKWQAAGCVCIFFLCCTVPLNLVELPFSKIQ